MKKQVRDAIEEHGVQGGGESVREHCTTTLTLGKEIQIFTIGEC